MTHAYSELYLNDAKNRLATMFDYAIHDLKEDADWFASLFVQSGYAKKFETGNPSVIAGMSGAEIAIKTMEYAYGEYNEIPMPSFQQNRSREYWAGWALAEYQWYSGESFKDIFSKVSFSQIVSMYNLYHEMDVTRFIERMMRYRMELQKETKLKTIRENRGVSQKELSDLSGVKLRSIQMYEQKVNDIDKAQGQTLFKLARVLGCRMEDLLENPSE